MRGYSIISDEERAQILNTHRSFYDGYATGNVPSNQTPLTVEDLAQDKKGLQVTNTGEVIEYSNHIHENVEEQVVIDAPDMDVSDVEPAYNFVSDGPEDGEMVMGEGEKCPSCGSPVEDCECEGHDHEIKEKEMCEQCEDIVFPDVRGWKRPNKGVSNREDYAVIYRKPESKMYINFRPHAANENIIFLNCMNCDGLIEKLGGKVNDSGDITTIEIKKEELQDKINIFKQWAESLKEEVVEKEMCEQCGSEMVEGECMECGMYEEIDEDLHEAFKAQREQILENFNRFKKFN